MIACKAYRNGSFRWIRLPDPKSHQKNFLVEIGRQLHLPREGQLPAIDTFYNQGFTHITDANGHLLYGRPPEKQTPRQVALQPAENAQQEDHEVARREGEEKSRTPLRFIECRRRFNRPRLFAGHRPIAVALAFAERACAA